MATVNLLNPREQAISLLRDQIESQSTKIVDLNHRIQQLQNRLNKFYPSKASLSNYTIVRLFQSLYLKMIQYVYVRTINQIQIQLKSYQDQELPTLQSRLKTLESDLSKEISIQQTLQQSNPCCLVEQPRERLQDKIVRSLSSLIPRLSSWAPKVVSVAAVVTLMAVSILKSQASHHTAVVDSSKMYNISLVADPALLLKILGPLDQRMIESL